MARAIEYFENGSLNWLQTTHLIDAARICFSVGISFNRFEDQSSFNAFILDNKAKINMSNELIQSSGAPITDSDIADDLYQYAHDHNSRFADKSTQVQITHFYGGQKESFNPSLVLNLIQSANDTELDNLVEVFKSHVHSRNTLINSFYRTPFNDQLNIERLCSNAGILYNRLKEDTPKEKRVLTMAVHRLKKSLTMFFDELKVPEYKDELL